jgi:hypothetical protein
MVVVAGGIRRIGERRWMEAVGDVLMLRYLT